MVTLAVAAAVGGYSLSVSVRTQIDRIDDGLTRNVAQIERDTTTPLAEALLLAKQDPAITVLALVDADREMTVLAGSPSSLPKSVPVDVLTAAANGSVELPAQSIRFRTVSLPDQEFIIIGSSVRAVNEFRTRNTGLLVQFALLAALLGGAVIVVVTRLDLRRVEKLIDSAGAVAQGQKVEVPQARGSSEVAELSRALERMVGTLQANADSEREMRMRMEDFLADASHELRTPLTVISGYLQILQAQPDAPLDRQQRALSRMSHEAERMRDLVANLLLLAEVGSVSTPQIEQFDFSQMVSAAAEDLQVLNPQRGVDAMVAPHIVVEGVQSHLQQLVANIISNIERHTPSDAAVRMRLWQESDQVRLRVEDAGPGLPALAEGEAEELAVREFGRFDQSRSRETGGSGLGMSIMAAIVDAHHGELFLRRSEMGGLRLDIDLPLRQTTADTARREG